MLDPRIYAAFTLRGEGHGAINLDITIMWCHVAGGIKKLEWSQLHRRSKRSAKLHCLATD